MRISLTGILISLSFSLWAQAPGKAEQFLSVKGRQILEAPEYEKRKAANDTFMVVLKKYISTKEGMEDPLKSVTNMQRLSADDEVCVYTWLMPDSVFHYQKFGLIAAKEGKEIEVTELKDESDDIEEPVFKTLRADNWYGALYYKIIPVKKGRKKIYTLLGYAPGKPVNQKIVEIMELDRKGRPRFGARVFHIEKFMDRVYRKPPMRLILSYGADYSASVRWNEDENMIVMDHLAPPDVKMRGVYQVYGPDMSYDGLVWKKDWWYLEEQVEFNSKQDVKIIPPDRPVSPAPTGNQRGSK